MKVETNETNTEPSSSNEPFVQKQVRWANEEIGTLNKRDGIDCPLCLNKGVVYSAVEGNAMPTMSPCDCMAKRKSFNYARLSGLGALLEKKEYVVTNDTQRQIKTLATEYITGKHAEWFCLLGQSGVGKTHICSGIARTFIDRSIETRYVVWNTFIREIKADNLKDGSMMYKYRKVPTLYIDDLFKGKVTEVDVTLAFDLLNYRYNNKLTTIITSELTFSDLMAIDSAIAGRIKERCGRFYIEISKGDSKNYRLK